LRADLVKHVALENLHQRRADLLVGAVDEVADGRALGAAFGVFYRLYFLVALRYRAVAAEAYLRVTHVVLLDVAADADDVARFHAAE